ncbi:ATP-binding protein [Metabacillus fastidiosus]|uniref:ATP-binding protein n=1 Tax=Metabacillus fastidiosus TaxID=1458 RepID=A0ABU6NRN5_9BACI|nr:ATP-binding protein [Metabacillus fastidiosus]MED4399816.1 ATP-binding protein [Metabacillus fastidiosus]
MEAILEETLKNLGMSSSSDNPDPIICNHCGNEREQIQIEHPFKKDEMRWVPIVCPCVQKQMEEQKRLQEFYEKRAKINRALKLSSSMDDIKSMTFENFKMRKGSETTLEEVKDAVANFEERKKLGVFIFGETGNGKSHCTAAGGNELIQKGYAVIFITEKDLLSRLAATKNYNNTESFNEIMSACLEADLLIWDDFMSSQRLANEEKDWIFQIINGRERANKPIWATSNLTPDEFKADATAYKLDDKGRTWWRLMANMNCIYNRATNYRKALAMARALDITVDEYDAGNR